LRIIVLDSAQQQHQAYYMAFRNTCWQLVCPHQSLKSILPSWSSVALRYDVAFNWSMNPFFHIVCQPRHPQRLASTHVNLMPTLAGCAAATVAAGDTICNACCNASQLLY
jgi:hypothetical protein